MHSFTRRPNPTSSRRYSRHVPPAPRRGDRVQAAADRAGARASSSAARSSTRPASSSPGARAGLLGRRQKTVLQSVAARTDSSGTFLLEGLDPLADLRLTAESKGLATAEPQSARAGADKPVKLVVSQANTVVLAGRVVDTAGKPVEGAEVQVRSQTRTPEGRVWRIDPVGFGDRNALAPTRRGGSERLTGSPTASSTRPRSRSRDMLPGQTVWLKPARGAKAAFADVTLRRLRTVEGVVHDRKGRPVEGAIVFQSGDGPIRTRTVTDLEGPLPTSRRHRGQGDPLRPQGRLPPPGPADRHRGRRGRV